MPNMMKTAEKAIQKRTNKMLVAATTRYKRFMKMAGKAVHDHKREQYLAAALGALVVTGIAASELKSRFEAKAKARPKAAKKKSVKKATTKKKAKARA
jgi:hypothetical protein